MVLVLPRETYANRDDAGSPSSSLVQRARSTLEALHHLGWAVQQHLWQAPQGKLNLLKSPLESSRSSSSRRARRAIGTQRAVQRALLYFN